MDAQDGLAFGDHQPGEVLGEVPPLGLVLEEVAELSQGVLDDLGELDDAWHDQMPGGTNCAGAYEAEKGLLLPFLPAATDCLQSPRHDHNNSKNECRPMCGQNSLTRSLRFP